MKTRRSKIGDVEAEAESGADNTLQIELPTELSSDELQRLLPDITLKAPSAEDVLHFYKLILRQAEDVSNLTHQLEEAQAGSMKKDVEMDQSLQEHDVRLKELEESLADRTDELEKLKEERNNLAAKTLTLESERSTLEKSKTTSSTEVETLKLSISELERGKRDLIGVIDRLRIDDEQRDGEVERLRAALKQLRTEFQDVQSSLSESRASETTSKFKIQHLEQQLQLVQNTAEATTAELTQKTEEFAKYRREKYAEIVSLTANLDTLNATHSATEATLQALQQSYNDQSRQLTKAMQKYTDLEARLADRTASYKSEAANQTRLIDLLESRNQQALLRVEEVEKEWDRMVKTSEEREERLAVELQSERSRAERLEGIVEELRTTTEREADNSIAVLESGSARGTPNRESAVFSLSPAAGVAARLQKSGRTFTEVYADYVHLQEELAASKSEERRVKELLSQVLADIEERTPLLAQQRQEFERIKQEADQLASQLAQALADRDRLKTHANDLERQLQQQTLLGRELEQCGNDLGRQVQHLTRQIALIENPALQDVALLPTASPDVLSADLALGSDEVVLFQNLPSLQAQNQMLLKIAHASALALDQKEREFREMMEKEESEAIREANEAISVLEEQLESQSKSNQLRIQAFSKELDFYKSLGTQAQRPQMPISNSQNGTALETTVIGDPALRTQFEAFKAETEIDANRVREEMGKIQEEAHLTAAELAKANGTIQFLNERLRQQNEAQQLKAVEFTRLQEQCQTLRDQASKLEISYFQTAENLSQANATVERMRTESANLRAERNIWKEIEARLTSENKNLTKERTQLADLVSNVQKLHEDLDRANEHDRRRQEGLIQALEVQIQDLKTQVMQERETVRSITLNREMELKELHQRLEKSIAEQSTATQALALADAKHKHLQERFEDISKQAEAQKEKLSVYERGSHHTLGVQLDPQSQGQSLQTELAQLSADLKTAQIELAQARGHVEQYKSISESNEQAFQQLSSSYEAFQATSASRLDEKEAEIKRMMETMNKMQDELTSAQGKITDLQRSIESERVAFKREQQSLETKLVEMTTSVANYDTDKADRDSEIKIQIERAKTAEKKYEDAIKAHAEAISIADKLKEQLVAAQNSTRESQTRADTAESRLTISTASWDNQKAMIDKEMADVNKRCQELTEQNELLHHQLEALGAQAARIRQAATSTEPSASEQGGAEVADQQLTDLRSVISYLRKEKEIIDLQLEMSKQDAARSRTEIEHLTRVLEETRALLTEERERAAQAATSAADHAELVERINQLNLLRESNATLRAESNANKQRVQQLEMQLASMTTELEPLKEKVHTLQAEVETKELQSQQLKKEAEHWQERNRQILSKYDKSDPAEIQQLKEKLEEATARTLTLETEIQAHKTRSTEESEQAEKIKKNLQMHRDALLKQRGQFKAYKDETDTKQMAAAQEIETLKAERDALQAKIDGELAQELSTLRSSIQALTEECAELKRQLEQEKSAKNNVTASVEDPQAITRLTSERDALALAKTSLEQQLASLASSTAKVDAMSDDERTALVAAKEAADKAVAESEQRRMATEEQNKSFRERLQKLIAELKAARERIATLEKEQTTQVAAQPILDSTSTEREDAIREEARKTAIAELTTQHQKELEALKTSISSTESAPQASNEVESSRLQSELAAAQAELATLNTAVETLRKEKGEAQAQGMEQGRKEMAVKVKLKDTQISKISKRLQELEAALATSTNTTTVTPPVAGSSTGASSSPVATSPSVTSGISQASTSQNGAATGGAPTVTSSTRGRGVSLRGAAGRGRGATRGATPAAATAAATTTPATATAGTTILGAAVKRARDGETDTGVDSLAKRLKPAAGGPITLNRSRPLPPESGT